MLIALRRENSEMVAPGEGKSLQQTDSKSKRPERKEQLQKAQGEGLAGDSSGPIAEGVGCPDKKKAEIRGVQDSRETTL